MSATQILANYYHSGLNLCPSERTTLRGLSINATLKDCEIDGMDIDSQIAGLVFHEFFSCFCSKESTDLQRSEAYSFFYHGSGRLVHDNGSIGDVYHRDDILSILKWESKISIDYIIKRIEAIRANDLDVNAKTSQPKLDDTMFEYVAAKPTKSYTNVVVHKKHEPVAPAYSENMEICLD